ncbi:hypothetical protein Poli38472_004896 [Pythium oligandrum]|uniref:Uncharacterized protein n=1 Tax=Pythium oligandrum TaxID=41045 RepID=A0A8K1CAX6_PYTOL|nr:hypothetical protein Poli38472_004896 [Pythium oligandrum]|eukprot:TMW59827.1 hypothetical protein Poli38472_004896 [Pythium oligandrum]
MSDDGCEMALHAAMSAFIDEFRLDDHEETETQLPDGGALLFPFVDDSNDVFSALEGDDCPDQLGSTVYTTAHEAEEPSQSHGAHTLTSLTSGAAGAMAKTAKDGKGRRWNTKREELLYLRATVDELEGKLTKLRAAEMKLESADTEPEELVDAVWEGVAKRQYEQRRRAESENAKIRVLLEEQLDVAKSLGRLLATKRSNIELLSSAAKAPKRHRRYRSTSPLGKATLIEDLLQTLGEMYEQVDELLKDPRFDPSTIPTITKHPLREVRLRSDLTRGTFVEIVEAKVLAIDFQTFGEVFWQNIDPTPKPHKHMYEETTHTSEHSFARSFEGVLTVQHATGEIRGHTIFRRFIEDTRIIITVCVLAEPEKLLGKKLEGILIRHQIWNVIQQLPGNRTCFQSYNACIPEVYEDGPDDRQKVGVVTNFILSTIDFHVGFTEQVLTNAMLKHAASSRPNSPEAIVS